LVTTKESEKPEESKDQKESKNNKTIFCLATRKKMENYTGGTIELLLSGDIQTGATTGEGVDEKYGYSP